MGSLRMDSLLYWYSTVNQSPESRGVNWTHLRVLRDQFGGPKSGRSCAKVQTHLFESSKANAIKDGDNSRFFAVFFPLEHDFSHSNTFFLEDFEHCHVRLRQLSRTNLGPWRALGSRVGETRPWGGSRGSDKQRPRLGMVGLP
jgi:hypothetical protein